MRIEQFRQQQGAIVVASHDDRLDMPYWNSVPMARGWVEFSH